MTSLSKRNRPARLILMAGLPGSGKTTLARELEVRGFLRLCPDEHVWRQYGHYGEDRQPIRVMVTIAPGDLNVLVYEMEV